MKNSKFQTVVLLLLMYAPVVCFAQQQISGPQSGTLGPGNYIVTGNIQVGAGQSLNIAPGTTFTHGSGQYVWEISGTFSAIGSVTDSIYFLSEDGIPLTQRWGGLRFLEGSPAATLNYCVVESAYIDVELDWPLEYVAAVSLYKGEGITIKHCRISNNHSIIFGGGVYVKDGFLLIDSCLIVHNYQESYPDGIGVFIEDSDNSQILNSILAYNECDLLGY